MELLTRKDHIASIPARWAEQYDGYRDYGDQWDKGPITKALNALDPGFTAEQVDNIIGNKSWTRFQCAECSADVDKLVQFEDSGEQYICVCIKCLRRAINLIR